MQQPSALRQPRDLTLFGELSESGTDGGPLQAGQLREQLMQRYYRTVMELSRLNDAQLAGCQRVIDTYDLPCYTTGVGGKGAVMYAPERLRDYRAYAGFDANAPSATLLAEAKNESLERQDGVITEPDSLTIRLAVADRDGRSDDQRSGTRQDARGAR